MKFSTGPTKKHLGYSLANINTTLLGRSHRCNEVSSFLQSIVHRTKHMLNIPHNYKVILTPGSDTGAMEIALWNMIGINNVDCIAFEHFGLMWYEDLKKLQINKTVTLFQDSYGTMPNIDAVDFTNNDVVLTLCGTTSGVVFNQFAKIPENRNGIIIADATSYILSEHIPWNKLDVITFSWQKAFGGEAQIGMMVLSPNAIARLNNYNPKRAIPHLFCIKENNKVQENLLDTGSPINTISILSALDFNSALDFFQKQGGLQYSIDKVNENFNIVINWIKESKDFALVPQNISYCSKMSICCQLINSSFLQKNLADKQIFIHNMINYFAENNIALDINSHRKAPLGIRFWTGPTIDATDINTLLHELSQYMKNI